MHWARRVFPFVAAGLGLAGAGFAATKRVEDPNRVLSLEVPGDWHVEAAKPGREGESVILARPLVGEATLRAFSGPRKAQSLDELARATFLDETKKHPGWKVPERETVVVHGLVGLRARRARPEESLAEELLLVLTPRHHVVVWLQCPADEAGRYGRAFRGILESVR